MKTLPILTAGLLSVTPIFARRIAVPLLLLGIGLLLVQPCAADSGSFIATGSLVTPRSHHSATLLPNGKVLVAGGIDSSFAHVLASAELYDPASGTWTPTGDMHGSRSFHMAILLPNGKVLAEVGQAYLGEPQAQSPERYDPASGAWVVTGPTDTPFDRTATLLPNGKVLFAGGNAGGNGVASAELYDPASETSTPTGSLGTARFRHTATLLLNGEVLVTGGYDGSGSLTTSAELYAPASGTWTATGSLPAVRDNPTATLLPNGKVLLAGGNANGAVLESVELYDPASGTWTATRSLNTARLGHTATLLPTGKVLVAGGSNSSGDLASAEVYDPASGSWTATGNLTNARQGHTATLLSNGNVLFAGGVNENGALSSAELYTVASPTAQLLNIATRLRVQTSDNVLIGGFIITGTDPKKVVILGIGPSLAKYFNGPLSDPTLELYQGDTLLQTNDDWKSDQQAEVEATGIPPTNDLESAIVRTLDPGSYTAILRGKGDATGIGVVEAYDLNQAANSKFANIATRGFVDTGDNAMFGGFTIGPASGTAATVVVRGIGPSLTGLGISEALQDPTLELHNGNGDIIAFNDDWKNDANEDKVPPSLRPGDERESVLYRVLGPDSYTVILRGSGSSTGIGLVEAYNVD